MITIGGNTKKVLSLSSGSKDRCSFVETVLGGAALEQYLRGAPKGTNVEAWEGGVLDPSLGIFRSLKGV